MPSSRRDFVKQVALMTSVVPAAVVAPAFAEESMNVDDFLKSGMVSMPMGVSGQAGKSKPETGVVLRDDVSQNGRTGDVLAEILVDGGGGSTEKKMTVLTSFAAPWPLAKGSVFDVECRDTKTGDGVFLQVTPPLNKKNLDGMDSFLLDTLLSKTGRFSFYGPPTDVKVRKAETIVKSGSSAYRVIDLSFATISQATQTELPRRGRLVATIPPGSNQAVMLVASASAVRWKNKGADEVITKTLDSFRAIPAPV